MFRKCSFTNTSLVSLESVNQFFGNFCVVVIVDCDEENTVRNCVTTIFGSFDMSSQLFGIKSALVWNFCDNILFETP